MHWRHACVRTSAATGALRFSPRGSIMSPLQLLLSVHTTDPSVASVGEGSLERYRPRWVDDADGAELDCFVNVEYDPARCVH